MKRKTLAHAIYRDRELTDQTAAVTADALWQLGGAGDARAERFEVILRFLLVVCAGAAMLTCGTAIGESNSLADRTLQSPSAISPARVAVEAAAALLPKPVIRGVQGLR